MILNLTESAHLEFLNELCEFNHSGEAVAESIITSECVYQILGDSDILMEGVSDIIDTIVTAIKNLLTAIKNFFVNIIRSIMAFSMDYRDFVKNYKDDLEKATPNFTFKGYTFEGLFKSEPDMSDFEKAIADYNSMISDVSPKDIEAHIAKIKQSLEERNLEELRGKVLGSRSPIEEGDFSETVRAYYRGCEGDSVKEEDIKVDSSYVRKLISDVDNIYRLKEKAEKDRKSISDLLAKTENFFSRKAAVVYRGSDKKINAQKVVYNQTDRKISFSDNEVSYTDKGDKAINSLINAMYSQVRVIAGIINTCISERAIGFRDYTKQCRKILGEAVTSRDDGSKKDVSIEGYEILDGSALEEATNYTILYEQVRLFESRYNGIPEIQYQLQEAHRAIALYETGILPEPVMEGIIGGIVDGVKNFVSNLVGMFRKKQVENVKKYEGWYNNQEILDAVVAASSSKEYTALPLWDGIWGPNAVGEISKLLGMANQKPTDPDSANFAKAISGHDTLEALKGDKKASTKILNHYRVGKAEDYIKPEKIGGTKLAANVGKMFQFMGEYEKISAAAQQIKTKVDQLRAPAGEEKNDKKTAAQPTAKPAVATEGYEYYLRLAGVLMEETSAGNEPAAATKAVNDEGNKEHQQAATQIREISDSNNKSEEAKGESGKEEKEKPATETDYYKQLYPYIQRVISSYLTTLEERYVLYWKLLTSIAPEEFKPIFKDGVYQGTKKTGLKDKATDVVEKVTKRQDATRLSGGNVKSKKKK